MILRLLVLVAFILPSGRAWACACGCGVFDVGTASMYPLATGGMIFLESDALDQNQKQILARLERKKIL